MNWSERLQLAGMVFGMVFVAPAVLASIEMSKPYAAGASFIQLYWPKSAVYALTFTVLLTYRFLIIPRKSARLRRILPPNSEP